MVVNPSKLVRLSSEQIKTCNSAVFFYMGTVFIFSSPKDCRGLDFVIYFQCHLKTMNSLISLQWYQKCVGSNL